MNPSQPVPARPGRGRECQSQSPSFPTGRGRGLAHDKTTTKHKQNGTGSTHALYRFYDTTGRLLYVGVTLDPAARFRQHRRSQPWWTDVARIELQTYPNRPSVLIAEREAILTERPLRNIAHNTPADEWSLRIARIATECAYDGYPIEPGDEYWQPPSSAAVICCSCHYLGIPA